MRLDHTFVQLAQRKNLAHSRWQHDWTEKRNVLCAGCGRIWVSDKLLHADPLRIAASPGKPASAEQQGCEGAANLNASNCMRRASQVASAGVRWGAQSMCSALSRCSRSSESQSALAPSTCQRRKSLAGLHLCCPHWEHPFVVLYGCAMQWDLRELCWPLLPNNTSRWRQRHVPTTSDTRKPTLRLRAAADSGWQSAGH